MSPADRVIVARIAGAHGIKGEVRLKSYTEVPMAVVGYAPLAAPDGRRFEIVAARAASGTSADVLVVRIKGIADRAAAQALGGIELSVARDRLPATERDEFYHADLIGLAAATVAGRPLGTVVAVQNYGAGDLLEIAARRGAAILVPFTKAMVPTVDVAGGRVVVDPPPGLIDEDEVAG